jgi:hypothetical protein
MRGNHASTVLALLLVLTASAWAERVLVVVDDVAKDSGRYTTLIDKMKGNRQ